jgi:hypothetical protein
MWMLPHKSYQLSPPEKLKMCDGGHIDFFCFSEDTLCSREIEITFK